MIVIKQGLVTVGKKQEIVMFLYPARIKKMIIVIGFYLRFLCR